MMSKERPSRAREAEKTVPQKTAMIEAAPTVVRMDAAAPATTSVGVTAQVDAADLDMEGRVRRKVRRHRQCKLCYGGRGGIGNRYSQYGRKRYYKCDTCGHTWPHVFPSDEVMEDE